MPTARQLAERWALHKRRVRRMVDTGEISCIVVTDHTERLGLGVAA